VTTPAFSIFAVNVKEFALHIDPDSPGFGYSPETGYHHSGSQKAMDSF
jgi:hypothetical protein